MFNINCNTIINFFVFISCKFNLLFYNISIKYDGDERLYLSPWYAIMYVKEEFRGSGYSKLLNDAILEEAKNRGFRKFNL